MFLYALIAIHGRFYTTLPVVYIPVKSADTNTSNIFIDLSEN